MMHRPGTQHNFSGRHPNPRSAKGKFLPIVKPFLAVLNIILLLSTGAPLALAQGRLTTYPDIMGFGNVAVGQSKVISMEIKNTGGASLVVSGQSIVGAGFSVSGLTLPLTLAVGATTTFNVVFAPKGAGSVTGSLQLLNNTTIGPGVVTLYGTGTGGSTGSTGTGSVSTGSSGSSPAPAYLSANSLSAQFGSVPVGTQNTQAIALKNTGGQSLSISSIAAKGTGFAVTGFTTPIALAAGAQTQITVAFLPTTATSFSGSVAIASNASDSQITIVLTGTGTGSSQTLSVSPTSLVFGNVDVNGSETQQVTLKNTGNSSLTISSAVISGTGLTASGVSNNTTLAAGQSAVLVADFAPKATGSVTGSIQITSNASNGASITVPVTGTGVSASTHVVTLNWQASTTSGVTGYYVFRSSVSGGPYAQIVGSPVSGTTYSDSNVTAGAEYYYVVTAVNSNGSQSSYSNQVTATVP
jgi:Abnormal spindle-like microcephaly-assoc'd, ASPM-SPD-2-Hydin/Protein of unknown function (DUF1573)